MKSKIFLIMGIVLTIIMIVFVIFALQHPEMSFRWGNTITYLFYLVYIVVTITMYVLYFKR